MAKVLKVVMSVCAPEKSIVPWAWATLVSESARRVGTIARMASMSFRLTLWFRKHERNDMGILLVACIDRHEGKLMPFCRLVQDFLTISPYILSMVDGCGFSQAALVVLAGSPSADVSFFSNLTNSPGRIVRRMGLRHDRCASDGRTPYLPSN